MTKDWEYWVIDGRSASYKIVAKTANHKAETFYFDYWDAAWKWYCDHSNYYKDLGIKYQYEIYVKAKKEWLPSEVRSNI